MRYMYMTKNNYSSRSHQISTFFNSPNPNVQGKYIIAYVKRSLIQFVYLLKNYFELKWNVFIFILKTIELTRCACFALWLFIKKFKLSLNKDVLSFQFTHHIYSFSGNWRLEIHSNGARSIFSLDLYSCLSSRNCWDYL